MILLELWLKTRMIIFIKEVLKGDADEYYKKNYDSFRYETRGNQNVSISK